MDNATRTALKEAAELRINQLKDPDTGVYQVNTGKGGAGHVIVVESIPHRVVVATGVATDGESNQLVDETKNFEVDILKDKLIRLVVNGVEYYRKITTNTASTISFPSLRDAEPALVVVGDAEAGQVTITCVTEGADGNAFSVQYVAAEGESQPTTADLEGLVLTVTLGTGPDGEVNAVGMNVVDAIALLDEFTAEMTGAGGAVQVTDGDLQFAGGQDAIVAEAGTPYEVMP